MQLTPTQQRVYNHIRYEVKHGNHRLYHAAIADACNLSKSHTRHIVYQLRDMGVITISYPFEVNSRDREAPIYRLSRGRVVPFFGKSKRHPSRKESFNITPPLQEVAPVVRSRPKRIVKSVADLTRYYAEIKRRMERQLAKWAELELPALRSELERFTNFARKRPCLFLKLCVEKLERMVVRFSPRESASGSDGRGGSGYRPPSLRASALHSAVGLGE